MGEKLFSALWEPFLEAVPCVRVCADSVSSSIAGCRRLLGFCDPGAGFLCFATRSVKAFFSAVQWILVAIEEIALLLACWDDFRCGE